MPTFPFAATTRASPSSGGPDCEVVHSRSVAGLNTFVDKPGDSVLRLGVLVPYDGVLVATLDGVVMVGETVVTRAQPDNAPFEPARMTSTSSPPAPKLEVTPPISRSPPERTRRDWTMSLPPPP